MIRCTRCGRRMKEESPTGLGPRCQLAVLGPRPKRQAAQAKPARASRDDATPDLFAPNVFPWVLAA
jgi:hypothetical protein